ncbi:MAG: arylsulfatase [Verrucomicrobiae bacterium]|nr:arylsulfatase [Verrucomicrobiae bacterium]
MRSVCLLFLWLVLAFGLVAQEKPNFLIIFADDLGYSDLGCYGGEISTPNLDRLAANGLRFTQFYNTTRCWPSRAALMTGYYAQQIRRDAFPGGPGGARGVRPQWARLLPDLLRPVGYRSYHSGKWHIDGKQLENGFDRAYCLDDWNRNFNPQNHTEDDKPLPPVALGSGYYSSTAITDYAIKYLREHAAQHAGRPFFLYLNYIVPHFPLQAPSDYIAKYRAKYGVGWDVIRKQRYARLRKMGIVNCPLSPLEPNVGPPYHHPDAFEKLGPGEVRFPIPWRELTAQQREFQSTKMAIHAAMVDHMDHEIGRVIEQLRAMNALDNTLILFLTDNGASAEIMVRGDGHDPNAPPGSAATFLCLGPGWSSAANTPFRRHKVWVHEGGIATPLIAHWPKGIHTRGKLRHTPMHVIDIAATVLELAGARLHPEAPPCPAKSLVPLFQKDGTVQHDYLWWLHEGNRAIRVGNWKLVSAAKDGGEWELYDMKTDRSETRNLAARYPEKVKELAALWQQKADEFRALALKDAPAELPRKQGKKSKAQ